MRVEGVAPLPMRLNTYERIKQDSEFRKIKSGKYKKLYEFEPKYKKSVGSAIGTIYEKNKINPKSGRYDKKKWLGKIGLASEISISNYKSSKSSSFLGITSSYLNINPILPDRKIECKMNLTVLLEYIANNLYRLLGDGSFETTKMRLSYLPLVDNFTKKHLEVQALTVSYNIKKTLRVMSKWVNGYHDLGELEVKDGNTTLSFIDYIKKYKKPPELVIEPKKNQEIKLKGIMGVLAAATSLADIDVFGGSGKNTGFIIERDENGKMIRARVIKIDPGFAFSYDKIKKQKLKNPKDIVIETTHSIIVEWKNLTESQKQEFLEVTRI
jgi:hypothetical protein